MTSRRSILLSVVLGAFLSIFALGTANAQVPRSISYQGLLMKNGTPVNAQANLKINIYNAAGSLLYTESYNQVQIANGVFNVSIGTSTPLPPTLKFDEQYFLGVEVDNTGEVQPRTPFTAAPYALNAQTVGGIGVSTTPAPGMLLPLDKNGKVPASVLPQNVSGVQTINNIFPDSTGNFKIDVTAPLIKFDDAPNNRIVLSLAAGATSKPDTLIPGAGINVIYDPNVPLGSDHLKTTIEIAQQGITPGMLGTGAVLGRNLDQNIPNLGLWQDALGDLNIGLNSTLTYVTPTVAPAPGGMTNHGIGINLSNPNTWLALQTFNAGITVNGTTTLNGPVIVNGTAEPLAGLNGATYEIQDNGDLRVTGSTSILGNTFIGAATNGGTNTMGTSSQSTNTIQGVTNNVNATNSALSSTATSNNITATTSGTGAVNATNNITAQGGSTANVNNIVANGGAGTMNNIQAPANNIGTTQSAGNTNTIGSAGNSVNTITGSTNTVTGSTSNGIQSPANSIGTTQAGGNTNTMGTAGNSVNTITGLNNTITATGTNTVNGTTIVNGNETVNGNEQVNGTLSSTSNSTLGTNAGTVNTVGAGAGSSNTIGAAGSSTNVMQGANNTISATGTNTVNGTTVVNGNTSVFGTFSSSGSSTVGTGAGTVNTLGQGGGSTNTIGNAGTSTNTITGANNTMTASVLNTINGPTNINGNTQINGTLGNTGNLTLGSASTSNVYGAAGSANRFNGTSNFGTLPASNGNKLIVDGAANTNIPVGPAGVPAGFNTPTDFEVIDNGDLQVTGWASLNNLTAQNVWINGSLNFAPAATFCVNTVQTNTLTYWCGGPVGAAINVATAFNQGSLGTSPNNVFLGSNFNGNVTITAPGTNTISGNINNFNAGSQNNFNGGSTNVLTGTFSTAAGVVSTFNGNSIFNGTVTHNNTFNQNANSFFNNSLSTFNANNISLINGSNIIGNNSNTNISQIVNVQTQTVTIGNTPVQQTTLQATNSTGGPIVQTLAQVPGRIPVFMTQNAKLNPATPGPNGGASVTFSFGANSFDGTDAITVSYYNRNGNQFGSIYIANQSPVAGTVQIESTNPLDQNWVQVLILRD